MLLLIRLKEDFGGGGEDGVPEDKGRFEAEDEGPATSESSSLGSSG